MESVDTLLLAINREIINPIIIAAFAGTLVYFIFGVIKFIIDKQNGADTGNGRRHMLWGLIGMFIMTSVFGIMQFIVNTLKLDFDVKDPSTVQVDTGANANPNTNTGGITEFPVGNNSNNTAPCDVTNPSSPCYDSTIDGPTGATVSTPSSNPVIPPGGGTTTPTNSNGSDCSLTDPASPCYEPLD